MTHIGNVAADQLRSFVERIERLEEEKANTSVGIRDVYSEAKANGYDMKAMREIVKLRKLDRQKRDEQEYTLDLYKKALGMQYEMAIDDEEKKKA